MPIKQTLHHLIKIHYFYPKLKSPSLLGLPCIIRISTMLHNMEFYCDEVARHVAGNTVTRQLFLGHMGSLQINALVYEC